MWEPDFVVKAPVWVQEGCAESLTCTIEAEEGRDRHLISIILSVLQQFHKVVD